MSDSSWIYSDLTTGVCVGVFIGLVFGMVFSFTVLDPGDQKKVVNQGSGSFVTANEICASVYGAEYGHGEGLGQISCAVNGTWYDLGARDLAKALNSSYTIGETSK